MAKKGGGELSLQRERKSSPKLQTKIKAEILPTLSLFVRVPPATSLEALEELKSGKKDTAAGTGNEGTVFHPI